MKVILPVAVTFACFAFYLLPNAIDHELASGGVLSERGGTTSATGAGSFPRSESTYQGKGILWWARRAVQNKKDSLARGRTIRRLKRELAAREIGPTLAIRLVFGPHAAAALRVAWCESRWYTGASNGQYLGLFQMGSYARGRFGHSSSALGQARAAYQYFAASGFDWSPWECKP